MATGGGSGVNRVAMLGELELRRRLFGCQHRINGWDADGSPKFGGIGSIGITPQKARTISGI